MKLIHAGPAHDKREKLYKARIDCTWLNSDLESARVVVEEMAIVGKRGSRLKLDRSCAANGGMVDIDESIAREDFSPTIGDALVVLYAKFSARIEAAYTNDDVLSGKISETQAVLAGLT